MAAITMPKMSDTMEEGKVVKWYKHEGDEVHEGEAIAEIETDKANVEMEAFEPGVIRSILVHEGDSVPVGEPIAELESPQTAAAPQAPPEAAPEPAHPEIPVTAAPTPRATDQVPLVTAPPPPEAREGAPEVQQKPAEAPPEEERIKASPLARRMAEEHGIDLSQVRGTGPDGRIVEADIEGILQQQQPEAAPPPQPAPEAAPPPPQPAAQAAPEAPARPAAPPPAAAPGEEQELSRMRRTIAERMTKSKQTIPHFYVTMEVEMDWASRVREELNAEDGMKVSFNDIVIKACALALQKFPTVNASFDNYKLIMHRDINVGMAVALEDGLIAPVIHNADTKHLSDIAAETKELAKRARENQLTTSDYTGATFTVSNLGMFDVEEFIAIINPPESASLAIGTIREVPVVIDEQVAVSKRMKITLSADHRVLDGAVAARFMQEVKKRLEAPIGLL